MIADTIFLLFVVVVFSSFKIGVKTDKIFSWLTFLFLGGIFVNFYQYQNKFQESVFSFVWNSSPSGNITVDVISNAYNYYLVLPFLFMTLLSVGYNVVFRYEERRNYYNALVLFNLVSLILMITSNNLVQLISGVFIVDIMALLMIKDVEKSKLHATLNLIADMLLFTVLAVINCQLESLDLRQIVEYNKIGYHQDFVAGAGLIAVFIKLGVVPFHEGWLKLKDIRFHRLQNVLFLTSPVSALILLQKFFYLWQNSLLFLPILQIGCFIGICWGSVCLWCAENLKVKIIYMQMAFWPVLILLWADNQFVWSEFFTTLLICQYLGVCLLYFLYYKANRCASLLKIKNINIDSGAHCWNIFILYLAVFFAESQNIWLLQKKTDGMVLFGYFLFILTIAQIFHQFCFFSKKTEVKPVYHQSKKLFWFITSLAIVWVYKNDSNIMLLNKNFYSYLPLIFLLIMVFLPLPKFIYKIYNNKDIQDINIFDKIYNTLVAEPILWCGRILAVLIDRMLIEKMIVGAASLCLQSSIRLFRNIHYNRLWGGLAMIVLLCVLLAISYYNGRIE